MWKLVLVELTSRLINDRPPAFYFDLAEWRVNLPFLSLDEPLDYRDAMPTTAFLASSRVTLALIQFFQMMQDKLLLDQDRVFSVIALWGQVEDAVQGWKIVRPILHRRLYRAMAPKTCMHRLTCSLV